MKKSSAKRRHHWHSVLWLAAGVLIWHLAIAFGIDQCLPAVRDPEFAAKLQRLQMLRAENPDKPLMVALGSSRTTYGFHAEALGPTVDSRNPVSFNFGFPGGGPFMQRICYQRLREAGVRPTTILVEVLPVFFNGPAGERMEMRMLDSARLNAAEVSDLRSYAAGFWSRSRRWLLARALPEWRHQAEIARAVGLDRYRPEAAPEQPEDAIRPDGWLPRTDPQLVANRDAITELAHRQYDAFYEDFDVADGSLSQLRHLLNEARGDGVKIILVVMPEASGFRNLETDNYQRKFAELLGGLAAEFAAPAMDARNWVDDSGFYDGHHLLPEGAEAFTARLRMELLKVGTLAPR